ncbi:MAG: glycine--tRNA ligase subunit beta [Actinobacteria bacterium]|nr:glycine--tRNA ligase subunit beta [Actinomycetota bacterium]
MEKKLIFEIGTEELPSSCLNEGIASLKNIIYDRFIKNRLSFGKVETFGTPRRIIAEVRNLKDIQDSLEKIITGPPEKISYDPEGKPNQTARGFAKSLGITVEELEKIETDRGIYIGKRLFEEGKRTADILPSVLSECIFSIQFSIEMTWSDWKIKFARPIRWLLAVYGNEILNVEIESLKSGNVTFGHRTLCSNPIQISNADEMIKVLEKKGNVIADGTKRKEIILNKIKEIEEQNASEKFKIIINEDLLEEIVNLVEMPNVLLGQFPEKFLLLPQEILIKAIEYHQRYFAIVSERNNVLPKFIVVQNGVLDFNGEIIKGNERVLKARLSDAVFFYSEDKKHSWENWIEKLKGVIFYSGLGSMYDKEKRLEAISEKLILELRKKGSNISDDYVQYSKRASMLCKTDLVTNLVVEFPELQGTVGREYAKERNENAEVYEAIFEHYLPGYYGDKLPQTITGTILSIADKIDTITGMFLAGAVPSGSEDPFALRRRALGIVLSVLDKNFNLNIRDITKFSINLYNASLCLDEGKISKTVNEVVDFIIARFKYTYEKDGKRTDIIDAITNAGTFELPDINKRYYAISGIISEARIEDITLPMIRCRNIVKGSNFGEVNPELFKEDSEKSLYSKLVLKYEKIKKLNTVNEYEKSIEEIIDFRKVVDNFFDKVLVMDKAQEVQNNRINLVKRALDLYLMIADFSKIIVG